MKRLFKGKKKITAKITLAICLSLGAILSFIVYGLYGTDLPAPQGATEKIVIEHYTSLFFDIDITRIPANVTFLNETNKTLDFGISLDTDKIHFGILPLKVDPVREVELRNDKQRIAKAEIVSFGLEPMKVKEIEVYISPSEKITVPIKLSGEKKVGTTIGEIQVRTYSAKHRILTPLLVFI